MGLFARVVAAAVVTRAALLLYGSWQDNHCAGGSPRRTARGSSH